MKKKYSFNNDSVKKVLSIKVEGVFGPEDAEEFVKEYKEHIKIIAAEEYSLSFDCVDLAVSNTDMTPALEACFAMYKADGFKQVILDVGKKSVLKLQFKRLTRNVGLEVTIVENS